MAPRLDSSNNIDFLYKCIESNGVKIDFNKVGRALGLKPNAARMRYQRLQRSLESGLAGGVMVNTVSIPKKAGTKRKKFRPAKVSGPNKKVKMEDDSDSLVASDCDVEPGNGINEAAENNNGRRTRGIKTDYSKMLAPPEAPSEKSSSEEADDSVSDFETMLHEDSRSNHETSSQIVQSIEQTPPRILQSIEQTPPPTVDSVKQVSVSPQMTEDDESAAENSIYITPTPARAAKKTKPKTQILDDEPADDVRDELDALKCGQRIPENMFKKRKHNQTRSTFNSSPVPRPRPSTNARRRQDERRPGRYSGADKETLQLSSNRDSVSPDDSASMAGEGVVTHDMERPAAGASFLQRLSQFWK